MAARNILHLVKYNIKAAIPPSACRLFPTDSAIRRLQTVKFDIGVGAYSRTQPGKDVCEDAFFFWDNHDTAGFGRYATNRLVVFETF